MITVIYRERNWPSRNNLYACCLCRTLAGWNINPYMKEFYLEPPVFTVDNTIEDGGYLTVTGEITLKAANGTYNHYDYCDIWRFESGKIAELKAFVIEKKSSRLEIPV